MDMGGYSWIWEDMGGYLWIWGDIGGYRRILVGFHRFRGWRLQQATGTLKTPVWKAVRSDRPNL